MATNVFEAQIKAIDGASGPIRAMVRGMRSIIDAARGVAKTSAEGAKSAGRAGTAAAHAVKSAAEGVKSAGKTAEDAIHGVERAEKSAEAAHIRYFRSMGAHVRLMHGHFGSLNASIGAVSNSFTKFLPMLGALGAGGSLIGLFQMTKSAAESTIAMSALTAKLGITGKEFGGLAWAAKESGVETDAMVGGLEKLNRTLGLAAAGKGKDAAALFRHLGISMKDAAGHTRSTAALMPELADAFSKTTDPAMRALMATTLFGKQGQELLPILMKGREALEEMTRAGAKFAYVATPEQKQSLIDFGHNWEQLEAAIGGFKKEITANLAPVFAPIVAMARDWVLANRDWIATGIAGKVKVLAEGLKQLDLGEIIRQTTEWVKWTFDLIGAHGGLKTVLGGVVLLLGSPLISAVTGVIGVFGTLGRVIMGIGALMWANPILAAIGAVAVGAYLLYENWDWVKKQVGAVFDWFSHQNGWVKALLTAIAPLVFVPMQIYEHWEPIKAFFTSLWDGVTSAFDAAWARISPIVDSLKSAAKWVQGSWLGRHIAGAAGPTVEAARAAVPRVQSPANMRTYDDLPDGRPNPWANVAPPLQYLYRPDGPATQNLQNQGQVNVKVDFTNVPPGTKVQSDASGIAQPPDTSVGFSNPLAYGY